jgi:RNA polymerase sigma-70 factor (ECF subfamily)
MDPSQTTQEKMMVAPVALPSRAQSPGPARTVGAGLTFEEVYSGHFPFVWRSVRRLGIPAGSVEDAVQEVFVVVHRKLGEFEGRSSLKTWLFGIVLRVVRDQRRAMRRKGMPLAQEDPETVKDEAARGPDERAAKAEAVRALHALLDELDDEKREIFVLAELEQMSVPEIADVLSVNLNTVYSRLRAARQQFEEAVARHRARDRWRLK